MTRLAKMVLLQIPPGAPGGPVVCSVSLNVSPSIDLGGVYRAVFTTELGSVTLEVIGPGSDSDSVPVGPSGIISVSAGKDSSPAIDASSVSIVATNPSYSLSDSFSISESISLSTPFGEIAGCNSSTDIAVTISEG